MVMVRLMLLVVHERLIEPALALNDIMAAEMRDTEGR